MEAKKKRMVYGILEFLGEEYNNPESSTDAKESLEVATQCLETAFGIGIHDRQFKCRKTLRELYEEMAPDIAAGGGDVSVSFGSNNNEEKEH